MFSIYNNYAGWKRTLSLLFSEQLTVFSLFLPFQIQLKLIEIGKMFGLQYKINQVYTFSDYNEILRILAIDKIGKVTLDYSSPIKIIKYEIDNQTCIRLNDLVYYIESNFVTIHLAQLLILIQKLINRGIQLEQQNINHQYLDMNRIWLLLKTGSQIFSTLYTKVDYEIHFTGYQCPRYEKQTVKIQNMSESIQKIIIEIIKRCQNYIRLKNDSDTLKKQVQNQIFEFLIQQCENNSLLNILSHVGQLLSNCDHQNQLLPQYDQLDNGFKRKKRFQNVQDEMYKIMNNQLNQDPYNLELTYYFAVPFLADKMKQNLRYSTTPYSYAQVKYQYEEMRDIVKNTLQQDNLLQNLIKNYIDSLFVKIEKNFKFSDLTEQKDKMYKEIYQIISNLKIFNYFYNSVWMFLNDQYNYSERIQSFLTKIFPPIIDDLFNLFFQQKILELINEII